MIWWTIENNPWLEGHLQNIWGVNKFPNWFIIEKSTRNVTSSIYSSILVILF
jgi:hypothetical protein